MKGGQLDEEGADPNNSASRTDKIKHSDIIEERYEEVLAELIEYEELNKRLEREVTHLKNQLVNYKKEMEDIQARCIVELKSESS